MLRKVDGLLIIRIYFTLQAQNLSPAAIASKSYHVQVIQTIPITFSRFINGNENGEPLNKLFGFAHTSCSIKCPNEPSNLQTVFLIGQFRRVAISLWIDCSFVSLYF